MSGGGRLTESEKAEILAGDASPQTGDQMRAFDGDHIVARLCVHRRKLIKELEEVTALLELHRDARKTLADAYALALTERDEARSHLERAKFLLAAANVDLSPLRETATPTPGQTPGGGGR